MAPDSREWDAKNDKEEICKCQVDDENVGCGSGWYAWTPLALEEDCGNHQRVANET